MSFHKIILTGHVGDLGGRPVEVKRTPSGVPYCTFSVAVNPPKSGEGKATWYACSFWGKQAEVAAKYAEKGKPILIMGRPSVSEWTDREGRQRYTLEVSVTEFEFTGEAPLRSLLHEAELLDEREEYRRRAEALSGAGRK